MTEKYSVYCDCGFGSEIWMLPKLNGVQVARRLRHAGLNTRILMLTARDAPPDVIEDLDGADDYLIKPFAFEVLLARLRALERRTATTQLPVLRMLDLTVDEAADQVSRGAEVVKLSSREFNLLPFLMHRAGRIVPRRTLIAAVWGYESTIESNTLDAFIHLPRTKVDAPPPHRKLIHTVRGIGYCVRDTPPASDSARSARDSRCGTPRRSRPRRSCLASQSGSPCSKASTAPWATACATASSRITRHRLFGELAEGQDRAAATGGESRRDPRENLRSGSREPRIRDGERRAAAAATPRRRRDDRADRGDDPRAQALSRRRAGRTVDRASRERTARGGAARCVARRRGGGAQGAALRLVHSGSLVELWRGRIRRRARIADREPIIATTCRCSSTGSSKDSAIAVEQRSQLLEILQRGEAYRNGHGSNERFALQFSDLIAQRS